MKPADVKNTGIPHGLFKEGKIFRHALCRVIGEMRVVAGGEFHPVISGVFTRGEAERPFGRDVEDFGFERLNLVAQGVVGEGDQLYLGIARHGIGARKIAWADDPDLIPHRLQLCAQIFIGAHDPVHLGVPCVCDDEDFQMTTFRFAITLLT